MLNFFVRNYKSILLFEFLNRFRFLNLIKLPDISKIEIRFFISDISDLEDIKLLNFFQFMDQYFEIKKFPYIKKILLVNRKTYKFCVVYTFRKKEAFDIFELFISKINNLSIIERPSLISLFLFKKNHNLLIHLKKFTFFDDLVFSGDLPKIIGNIQISFVNMEKNGSLKILQKFLHFCGLNEDITIKII